MTDADSTPIAADGSDAAAAEPDGIDALRRRRLVRIPLWSAGIGVGLAIVSGVLGSEGRASVAILMLVLASGLALAALYGVMTAILDDMRGHEVSRARLLFVGGWFFGSTALMAMVASIGG